MNGSPKNYVIEVRGLSLQNFDSLAEIKREERKILSALDSLVRRHFKVGLYSKLVVSRIEEVEG